ncbi:MAG: DUF3164 family protein [Candidatus Aminicenantes bacterium]|jgi:hypothetical protein
MKKPRWFRTKKKAIYTNPEGDFVSAEVMKEMNILNEEIAEGLCLEAIKLSEKIAQFRERAFRLMIYYEHKKNKIRQKSMPKSQQSKIQPKKKKAGYATVTSYSGKYQVKVNAYPYYTFGDGFQVAKEMMAEVIHESITGEFQKEVREIFDRAFAMDREGQVNLPKIMRLMDYNIPDERWQTGRKILIEELRVLKRQAHISFKFRDDDDKLISIPLNISDKNLGRIKI